MTARKIGKFWYTDFRHDRVRYRKRSPENSRAGAEVYETVLRQKLLRGESLKDTEQEDSRKEREQKFKEFAWQWFEIYVKTNNKHSEISRKKYTLHAHLVPYFGGIPLNKISVKQIEEYKARKLKEKLTSKTINNHLTVLGVCLRTAQDWYELDKIPRIKKLKTPRKTSSSYRRKKASCC